MTVLGSTCISMFEAEPTYHSAPSSVLPQIFSSCPSGTLNRCFSFEADLYRYYFSAFIHISSDRCWLLFRNCPFQLWPALIRYPTFHLTSFWLPAGSSGPWFHCSSHIIWIEGHLPPPWRHCPCCQTISSYLAWEFGSKWWSPPLSSWAPPIPPGFSTAPPKPDSSWSAPPTKFYSN